VRLFSPILALIWGLSWALILQRLPLGRFVAVRRSWLAVVIGIAGDLVLLKPALPLGSWLRVAAVLGASSVGMILRSMLNEWRDHQELLARARGGRL
jgi:hypothetical protein